MDAPPCARTRPGRKGFVGGAACGAVRACVLVGTEQARERSVADALGKLEGVRECFPVVGRAEVVILAEAPDLEGVARLVQRVSATRGVLVSETLLEVPLPGPGARRQP